MHVHKNFFILYPQFCNRHIFTSDNTAMQLTMERVLVLYKWRRADALRQTSTRKPIVAQAAKKCGGCGAVPAEPLGIRHPLIPPS